MSNETKNKTAAETVAENVQAIAEATAAGAASAEEVATAAAEVAAVPTKFGKGSRPSPKPSAPMVRKPWERSAQSVWPPASATGLNACG